MSYKIYLPILIFALIALKKTFLIPVPTPQNPSFFLSNQSQIDLKRSLLKSIQNASKNIFISVYTLTDPDIIDALNRKAKNELPISLIVDKKQVLSLKKKLSNKIKLSSIKQRGLMHQKVFIFDETTYMGSSNLTTSSLRMHDNLMLGIYDVQFANKLEAALKNQENKSYLIKQDEFEFYTLPSSVALNRILSLIENAKESIYVAMFTFTHPKIFQALELAHKRGIKVCVILDYLSQKGASKKIAELLRGSSIKTMHNRGMQMMHHKFALIDNSILIMGSTNWTQSAFEKNRDDLVVLPKLDKSEQKFVFNLWKNLLWESKEI